MFISEKLQGEWACGKTTVYAIAFDMDAEMLKTLYGSASYSSAYTDIRKFLCDHGFEWQQGSSVYFGDRENINAVSCVLAVMALSARYPWFAPSVRDIRMLRIEEMNDLMPAVQQAAN